MKKKVLIVGTGSLAEVVYCYFQKYSDYEIIGFACNQTFKKSESFLDLPLYAIEDMHSYFNTNDILAFVAIGYSKMNKVRETVFNYIKNLGFDFVSFIHPNVEIWKNVKIGKNVFIFENNVIQPYVQIGNNSIFWSGNHVGHHSIIGDNCFISSHVVISGHCKIGHNNFFGVNSTITDNVNISDECFIGPNVLIKKNTRHKEVYLAKGFVAHRLTSDQIKF